MHSEKDYLRLRDQSNLQLERILALDSHAENYMQDEETSTRGYNYLSVFWRRKWLILLILALVLGAGALYTLTKQPIYESSAKIVAVNNQASNSFSESDAPILGELQSLTRGRSVATQIEMILSPDILTESYNRIRPEIRTDGFRSSNIPEWSYGVTTKGDTDVITVIGRAYTPEAAAMLANSIADTYLKRDLKNNSQVIRQARDYIGDRMTIAQKELAHANTQLAQFMSKTHFLSPNTQLTKAAEQMAQLSMDLSTARTEAASGKREVDSLRRELASQHQDVVSNTTFAPSPQFSTILENIDKLDSERATLLQEYTPNSVEVKQVENRIKHEESRLKQVASTIVSSKIRSRNPVRDELLTRYAAGVASVASSRARADAIQRELESREVTNTSLPEREKEYSTYAQRSALLQRAYDMLSSKYYTLMLSEQTVVPNGVLVSSAQASSSPASPNMKKNMVMFLLLGILISLIGVLTAEQLDRRLHDYNAIERVSGLTTLSVVPKTRRDAVQIVGGPNTDAAFLESFRILRNNIGFAGTDQQLKVLAVTSPSHGEGKSTTAINLASAMAMAGKRVLIVDCDLRRPSLHKRLGVSGKIGLTTVIKGTARLEKAIVPTETKNVYCLPAGPTPSNPAEILNSQRCREMFVELPKRYDIVVVDSPPAVGLSDVQVISTLVDGVVLVVSMHQTLRPHLDITRRSLAMAEAPLIGLVVNRMDINRRSYGYYNYASDNSNESQEIDVS